GAHPSGHIGESPAGIPNNLMPYVTQVAAGKLEKVSVFGDDYPTSDGTGVRDYVHVEDLARGHLAALTYLQSRPGFHVWNLGTGKGTSVLEIIDAAETAAGRRIPYSVTSRRAGDQAEVYADATKARDELGWRAEHDIEAMCRDHWNWQRSHPSGYDVG
ncbi:MAG: GDP-mannose 4,6-dehydratase, partial [Acidimicrobiales bacterium]